MKTANLVEAKQVTSRCYTAKRSSSLTDIINDNRRLFFFFVVFLLLIVSFPGCSPSAS